MKTIDQIQHEAGLRIRAALLQTVAEVNETLRANQETGHPPLRELSISIDSEFVGRKASRGDLVELILTDATVTFSVTR